MNGAKNSGLVAKNSIGSLGGDTSGKSLKGSFSQATLTTATPSLHSMYSAGSMTSNLSLSSSNPNNNANGSLGLGRDTLNSNSNNSVFRNGSLVKRNTTGNGLCGSSLNSSI